MHVTLNQDSLSAWQAQNLEHLRYEYYDLRPDDVVIDLGAYRGEWANEIFKRYKCKIILVEPGPWIVGCTAGLVLNKAAGTHYGKEKFGGAYYYTSSHEQPTHEYECFDINSLLSQENEIALLKINIEGAEYALLQHIIDRHQHTKIRNLQVQFHIIEGQPWQAWYDGIVAGLSLTHEIQWRWPFCWESWRRKAATEVLDEDYIERLNGQRE